MNTFYIVIELIIAVLSVTGNILVCWAVAINTTLKNATNYFLVSLAVADILVGCLGIPFAIIISLGLYLDFYGCLFLACFVLVLTQSSIFSLLAIAIDRYLAVKIPLRYNELMTGKRAREIIAVLWILSFVIGLIPFLGWNGKNSDHVCNQKQDNSSSSSSSSTGGDNATGPAAAGGSCKLTCFFESVVDMHYMVYFNFFVCVLLPLLIMLGIYLKIFIVARKQLRQIELKCVGNGDSQPNHSLLKREIRAAKSLSIIVGLFAVCWLPVHILNCLTLFYHVKSPIIMYVAIILSHANSAVNPVIYAYRIQDFRNTFRKILSQHFLCHREELYLSSNGSRRTRDQIHMTIDPLL
ncbi:adenosine receptor A2b [Lampris incognitus]|uniref:adenosine receptor A2b n=1 Tax=Lampris incognitus TaxID=2546036 RepID=UPI0024B4CC53|nr:adenosine receptor A2b [Lampris incognitus]